MYLGSLESTQEARVSLGCASSNSYASFTFCSKQPGPYFIFKREIPRGLVVRIRRSHRRGPGSIPGLGWYFTFALKSYFVFVSFYSQNYGFDKLIILSLNSAFF